MVGKRRRTISDRSKLLFTAQAQSFSALPQEKNVESAPLPGTGRSSDRGVDVCSSEGDGKGGNAQFNNSDWVTCPVCGKTVRGTDYMVNSHLDACLVRGTKRKLTQRTLLQLSFGSRSNSKTCSGESKDLEDAARQRRHDGKSEQNTISLLPEFGTVDVNGLNRCTSDSINCSLDNLETSSEVSVDKFTSEDAINCKEVGTLSHLPDIKTSMLDIGSVGDDMSVETLETFIVGRRFSDEIELKQGDCISLLRDPDNPKDPNAIKVVSTDPGCGKMLGFLPRELAKYLSPLIEKYGMLVEGSVTSLPKRTLDAVPIRLVRQEMIPYGEKESNDRHIFESLWKNAARLVEYEKTFPPTFTKYQRNFRVLIQEVLKHHAHLFTHDEKLFLESFDSLSDDSQRLFIRLYTRKGPWFRMSNISYPEISDSQQAIEELSVASYICSLESINEPSETDIKEVLDVLTVFELREISTTAHFKRRKGIHCTKKQEVIASLFAAFKDGTCPLLPAMILERIGACVRVSSTSEFLLWRILRLFFLNGEQDLSSFLLVDLGLVKYPAYTCNVSHHIFPDRSDLLAYEEAIEVAQMMDQSLDDNNMEVVIRCIEISDDHISSTPEKVAQFHVPESAGTFLSYFSASWVYSKVVTLGISFFERERRYEDAIRFLKCLLSRITCDGRRGYWTLRLSVNLEHLGRLNESLLVAEEGVLDPWVRSGSKMALQRRVLRLGKPPRRWKTPSFAESIKRKIREVHVRGRPLNCEMGMKSRFYGEDGEQCGVEELALQYYAGEGGWQGVHTECGIWLTIFGLLMWDIIFADIPDVFRTRFQTAPLDLDTDSFYIARKSLIESHLHKIQTGMAEEILISSWESHVGTACRGVNWDRHCLLDLRAAVSCIGGPCLAYLCRHLAQDYRSWSSGMPDLLLWRFSGEYRGEAKLVEVKGPRDKLSEQQRAWMLLLMDCGFDTEVCKVSPMSPSL